MSTRYVCGFLLDHEGRDLLLVKKLHGPLNNINKFNGIGGKIEGDETDDAAMVREFYEETGLLIETWEAFCELVGRGWEVKFFRASAPDDISLSNFIGKENDANEPFEVMTLHSTICSSKVVDNLRWLLPMAFLDPQMQWADVINV